MPLLQNPRPWLAFAVAKELRVCGLEHEVRRRQAAAWYSGARRLARADVHAAGLRVVGQIVFASAYVGAMLLVMWNAASGQRTVGYLILTIRSVGQPDSRHFGPSPPVH